jgi:septal ring factor EnvC (AmiA/AmiB activator)
MDEQVFQTKLSELMNEISTLPASERAKLEQLAAATQQRHQKLRKTVTDLQESMDYLRLSIKYMMFDLEATRRENNYLRKMLEEAHKRPEDRRDERQDDDTETA